MDQIHFVYKTTNLITNEYYIGKHSTFHINDNYFGSGLSLQEAIKEYGKDNFEVEIIEFCKSSEEAFDREKEILSNRWLIDPLCYNRIEGGGTISLKNHRPSEETRLKMSKASQKRWKSYSQRLRMKEMMTLRWEDPLFRKKVKKGNDENIRTF